MAEQVYPNEKRFHEQRSAPGQRWKSPPILHELKSKAREAGLWNLFLPELPHGAGLSNLEYAPLAERMGRVSWCAEVFNCSAPDAGNMEILLRYGTEEQQQRWLHPLLEGQIRSCFAMTEPAIASSDPINLVTSIRREADSYVINGHKWFVTNAQYEACRVMIVMGKSAPLTSELHLQHSQVLVPMDTPGVEVLRSLTTFGYDDAPVGHAEIKLTDVRVPLTNILLGEGRGFEVAQGRLGAGRIHHCMRLIGAAQRALELACQRAVSRTTFGEKLADHGSIREDIAISAAEIEQARLLTLRAADKMDREGAKAARDLIAMAKISVPATAARVIDRAIQIHGAAGFTADYPLAEAYVYSRCVRVIDGPDQVHLRALGKDTIRKYTG